MRVAVIGFNHAPGGTRTAYREFLAFLIGQGFEVGAISIADADEWIPKGTIFHSHVEFSRKWIGIPKATKSLEAIYRCRRFKPDIFISIGLTRVGNLISRSLERNCFRICQDVSYGRNPMESSFTNARRNFDAIAPQAPSMARELRRQGFSDGQMRWLPCFAERPVSGFRANPGLRHPYRLGYFGRLAPHKGIDLLIKALAAEGVTNELRLDVWGTGESDSYNALAASLGVGEHVSFMGAYPFAQDGAELMASYDALALTTLGNEGLPLVLIEAMAYGLPLLTTAVAAIPDCCEGNPDAVMVEPTFEGVRSGLRQLVAQLKAGSFSAQRQQKFHAQHFSHAAMSRRWLECLDNPSKFFTYEE